MGARLQVGICDFKIYLLKSGSITRGHGATGAHFDPDDPDDPDDPGHPHLSLDFPHDLQLPSDFLHPHIDFGKLHLLQGRASEKPSFEPPTRTRSPSELALYMKPAIPAEASIIATIPINAI
jgi:hypothetical protein